MMPQPFSLACLLTCAAASLAQPDFSADAFFKVGDMGKVGFVIKTDSLAVYLAQSGDNRTWDFSGESWTAPAGSYSIRDAESTNRPTFAASTLNEYAVTTIARDVYYSISENKDTIYLDGMMTGATAYAYKPRVPYLILPLAFEDSGMTSVTQFAVPTQPTNATGSISRWWHFDGYGTLKLPYGEAEAVTRIYTRQVDSSYVLKTGTVYEELIWFRNEGGLPILRMVKQGTAVAIYYTSLDDQSPIRHAPNQRMLHSRTPLILRLSKHHGSLRLFHVLEMAGHADTRQPNAFDGLGRRLEITKP